jgi:chromosome partitioning protein
VIAAFLDRNGCLRPTTLALHLAGVWVREGKCILLVDADPKGSVFDRCHRRAGQRNLRHVGLGPIAADTRSRDAPGCARDIDSPIVVGALRGAGIGGAAS